jgi:hypothetical protein
MIGIDPFSKEEIETLLSEAGLSNKSIGKFRRSQPLIEVI